jgi:hypothetical protein
LSKLRDEFGTTVTMSVLGILREGLLARPHES